MIRYSPGLIVAFVGQLRGGVARPLTLEALADVPVRNAVPHKDDPRSAMLYGRCELPLPLHVDAGRTVVDAQALNISVLFEVRSQQYIPI